MINRWNPMSEMVAMHRTIDSMFDEAWRPLYDHNLAMDIDETQTAYTVTAAIPGIEPENINIQMHDRVLTIRGEIRREREETEGDDANKRVIMRERRYGHFSRSVRLAQPVAAESVEATYENGILKLVLPKTDDAQPHRIPINVS